MRAWRAGPDEEPLSNRWATFLLKFVWPVFGIGSVPGFLLALVWAPLPRPGLVFIGVFVVVVFPSYYWFICRQLRWVWAGPNALRVSDGRQEVSIPYGDIQDVRQYRLSGDLVRVALRVRTAAGESFLFIPRWRFVRFRRHPVVSRLRERAGLPLW